MPDGSPFSNMRVGFDCELVNAFFSYGLSAVNTDTNGCFIFEGLNPHPDLNYSISIDPGDGWQPIHAEVKPGDVLNYTLQKGLPLKGRVIDQKTGLPLEGVSVGLINIAGLSLENATATEIKTDSNGCFSISTLTPEPYLLGVYTQTNRFIVTSPKPTKLPPEIAPLGTNMFTTITGGKDEYIELTVQATNLLSLP
jgi:hypothetical protein